MLKQWIIKVVIGLALLAAVGGLAGVVADSLGLPVTPAAYACPNGGSSGGGC